jgi:hypothetical protein
MPDYLRVNGRLAKHQFVVPSESSDKEYVVTQFDDPPFDEEHHPEWACGCRGGQVTSPDGIVNTLFTREPEAR